MIIRLGRGKRGKGSKKSKVDVPEAQLRVALDMCSKRGDVMGAIALYDSAGREGIKMGQYHYTVLLYLCSSAAVGVVQPAKSGSGNRSLNSLDLSNEVSGDSCVDVGEFGEMGKGNLDSTQREIPFSNNGLLVNSGKSHGNSDKMELNFSRIPLEIEKDDVDSNLNEKEDLALFSNGFMKPRAQSLNRLVHLSRE
ncbi:hypothetical protein L1049_000216 [Liquidambar formosana]|uniref:PROP1-like PPR domain-containing protein n=1 Tax=Liquidambar formosana TaxID=63359 RepID=A0AAP0N8J7_LIQFO